MPTVPTFQSQTNAPRVPNVSVPENVGVDFSPITRQGEAFQEAIKQVQLRADRVKVTQADTQRESWVNSRLYDPQNGAFTLEGENAVGITPKVLSEYDQHTSQVASTLTNPRQQRAFQESAMQGRVALQNQLSRFELQQHNRFEDDTNTARIQTATESAALNYSDPASINNARVTIDGVLNNQRESKGWSPEVFNLNKQNALGKMHSDVVDRMVSNGALQNARDYLKSSDQEVTAQEKLRLTKLIDAAQREQDAEAKRQQAKLWADLAPRVQDASAAYLRGLNVPNAPTMTELLAARPDDAKEIYDSLQRDRVMGKDLKAFAAQSPEDIKATLDKYTPDQNGMVKAGLSAKDALARQDELKQAAQQSLTERQRNPARFVIDNNLGWTPLPQSQQGITDELKKREASQDSLARQIGVRPPLLAPEEAKQISAVLSKASEQQTLQTYDWLHSTLSPDSYRSVMQQIAPDSPVKAYIGMVYGTPGAQTTATHVFKADESRAFGDIAHTMLVGENIINKSKAAKSEDGKPVGNLFVPDRQQFETAFAQFVGDAFAGRPDAQDLALQAAYSYYVGKAAETGRNNQTTKEIDAGLVKQSLNAAVGTPDNYHGNGTVLLPLGMDASTFHDRVQTAFVQEAKSRGIDEKTALSALPSLGLTNRGDGTYLMTQGKMPFADTKRQPFIINVNENSPQVTQGVNDRRAALEAELQNLGTGRQGFTRRQQIRKELEAL